MEVDIANGPIEAMGLNSKQRKTLKDVFDRPTRTNIRWSDVENLFIAVGARVTEGKGSRVRIDMNDHVRTFHRPHPGKEAKRYAVEAVRAFLRENGIEPEQ
ncbi:MAG: type II toxin-antitoxin system HicA family toxin [Caldilineaceae bacterium]|nr:type II toxin-antitoxin system HicA family toxin [Caldilineaceae bacterium]